MKKILITLLSLIMAFVMCFTVVACGGDTDNSSENTDNKKPEDENSVSIKLNDALDVINGVLNSEGFTATATYSMSTKNTEALTDSVTIDKRGSKIQVGDDLIIDYETGYWYEKVSDGEYVFDQNMTAGEVEYIQYLIAGFAGGEDQEITAHYDEETKTVKFYLNLADNVNKYLDPLYSAYSKSKNVGVMLDDYSKLLFGKKFDEVYKLVEAYIKNPKNTVGSLFELLKDQAGVDVEALLEQFDVPVSEEMLKTLKQRKLGEAVVGAYNYLKQVLGDMIGGAMPTAESADIATDDDNAYEGGGMESIAAGLLNAMLTSKVSKEQIETAFADINDLLTNLKKLSVKMIIDMVLAEDKQFAELYTVIKEGVKFKDISMTVTLTVDDNKTVTGLKADFLTAHTYTGKAPEGYTFLADNDYLISAELKVGEYKTEVEDFDIKFSPQATYKHAVAQVVYEFTDKDISVYYETAGNKIEIAAYTVETQTPDGKLTQIQNVPEDAFKFDEKTSSFVFDAAFVKSVLEETTAGTCLRATVKFDEEDYTWYCITLVNLNDDIENVSSYLTDYFMSIIMDNIGGAGSNMPGQPNVTVPQA